MDIILFQSLLFWIDIFSSINKWKSVAAIIMQAETNFFILFEKIIEYSGFAVKVVLSSPGVGPSPRIKISLFLLSICADYLI